MPWRNGLYVRLESWVARAAAGATISAVEFDADGNDVALALNNCVLRDGMGVPTADLPMASHSLTGIRQAAAAGEPVEFAQAKTLIAAGAGAVSNRVQNASFLINQRSASGTITLAANAYGHDRWKGGASGATYSVGAIGADGQATVTAGSLVQVVVASDIDAATMTVSQAGTAQGRLYPSGGSPPAFQACPFTVTNLTPGQSAVLEWATGTVLQPQVQPGTGASSFSRRPYALDAVLCQAFFERVPFRFSLDSQQVSPLLPFAFKTSKIAGPAITVAMSAGNYSSAPTAGDITTESFTISFQTAATVAYGTGVAAASCEP